MAIAIGKVNLPTTNHVIGNRREITCDITLDNSYPTGGYSLTPTQFGLPLTLDFILATPTTTGHVLVYNYVTSKLMAFVSNVEVANATDLSAVVARVVAHGKGYGI